MKLIQRWSKIVLILMLFVMGLGIISVLNFFGSEPEMVSAPIPKDSEMIVRIDAKTFWRKGVYSIVFEAENYSMIDQELKKVINNKFIKRKSKLLPIDLNKDIVAFTLHEGKTVFQVAIFQLMDVTQFMKISGEKRTKHNLAFHIGNSGYIIYGPRNCSQAELNAVKRKIESSEEVAFETLGKRSDFITVKSGMKNSKNKYEIGVQQSKESFTINGTVKGKIDFEPLKYAVKNDGLTITMAYLPTSMSDKFENIFPNIKSNAALMSGLPDPFPYFSKNKLTGMSVDFQGLNVENQVSGIPSIQGILPLPKMNAVFRFEKPLSMDSVMAMFPADVKTGPSSIVLYNINYHIRLIDDYHLFIGMNEKAVIPGSRADVFTLRGDLSRLTNIDGTSLFVVAVLKNLTPIKNTSNFAKASKNIDFALQKVSNNNYSINGILPFKEGKNSINEIFKFILLSTTNFSEEGRIVP